MHQVEAFEVLFQSAIDHLVASFEPAKRGHVVGGGTGAGHRRLDIAAVVQVDEYVVVGDHVVQGGQHVTVGRVGGGARVRVTNRTESSEEYPTYRKRLSIT